VDTIEIDTQQGPGGAHLQHAPAARAAIILGHGAGGGITAPDLQAAAGAAAQQGVSVALTEQPYRLAGRRSPAPAAQLDAAFTAIVERLAADRFAGLPLILGGRSSGARVACRTAAALAPAGVLCLAFPLLPARRAGSAREPQSRLPELEAVTAPVLIVQGRNDRFGMPPPGPGREVVTVAGDHSLRRDMPGLRAAVSDWLGRTLAAAANI
jgi:hypothetical protein